MPTEVRNRLAQGDPNLHRPSLANALPDHDPVNLNKNLQHREALRLALGTIFSPKRPYHQHTSSYPVSRSSSGTASPAHPFSNPISPGLSTATVPLSSPSLPPTPPHPTPTHGHSYNSYVHSMHGSFSSLQPPSKLSRSKSASGELPTLKDDSASATKSPLLNPASIPLPYDRNLPAPQGTSASPSLDGKEDHQPRSGSGTPKAKFIQTLQSKSAWDALIHGSFS